MPMGSRLGYFSLVVIGLCLLLSSIGATSSAEESPAPLSFLGDGIHPGSLHSLSSSIVKSDDDPLESQSMVADLSHLPRPSSSSSIRARRSYQTEGDAYIRFGKRNSNPSANTPEIYRRSPPEQSYIRFGKRESGQTDLRPRSEAWDSRPKQRQPAFVIPCTLAFLRVLKTSKERIDHLHECSKYRGIHRRSEDDRYIRFGKRSGESIGDQSEANESQEPREKCFFLHKDQRSLSPRLAHMVEDCSSLSETDLSSSVIVLFR